MAAAMKYILFLSLFCSHWCVAHLFQHCQHQRDLLRVEQALRHQGQAGLSVPLQLVIALVIFHRGDLAIENDGEESENIITS